VPEGELNKWTHGPFSGEVVENLLYGRGAADAKASVAAMVMAAKALAVSGLNLAGSLEINPVCDEETGGGKGTRYLLEQGEMEPDYVVVGEITGNRVAVAEKGIIQIELKTLGKSAHASTPWDGVNAVDQMLLLYNRIRAYYADHMQEKTHPLTPPSSINLGLIRGA
jgi:succinyl-diaminopimelate desuccinylase